MNAASRVTRALTCLALAILPGLAAAGPAQALGLQEVGDYTDPVYVTSLPGDAGRLLVVEIGGRIEFSDGDTLLDLRGLVSTEGEGGILSMAVSPDFAGSGRFYVLYTEAGSGDIRVDEFVAVDGRADPANRRPVIEIEHSFSPWHYGGQIQFGPDGYLYISTGDGGFPADPHEHAQDTGGLHGKLLRIDPDPSGAQGYSIPPGNPFVGAPGADEIWSYGLRNPWRFSFDRHTGALFVADVGQDAWEEVNYAPASAGGGRGANFGWDCREGAHDFEPAGCAGPFADPSFEYPNDLARCAITGGYVSRDEGAPEVEGRYVYADFCSGEIRSQDPADPFATDRSEGLHVPYPVSFGEDSCGRLYVASIGVHREDDGAVYRLTGAGRSACGRGASDLTGPGFSLTGRAKQAVGRRLSVTATVDEAAVAELGARIVSARRGRVLLTLHGTAARLEAGAAQRLGLGLTRAQARRFRALVLDGRKLEVRFAGAATDGAGNRGSEATHVARLVSG